MFTRRRIAGLLLAAVLPLIAIVVFLGGSSSSAAPTAARGAPANIRQAAPDAASFADRFLGVTNEYARQHGDHRRIGGVHCVEAATGRYMCVYSVTRPRRPSECHLMQARWTPEGTSSFAVTLAGRTRKCGSVREAIRTMP